MVQNKKKVEVQEWLNDLQLGKYEDTIWENEYTMDTIRALNNSGIEDMIEAIKCDEPSAKKLRNELEVKIIVFDFDKTISVRHSLFYLVYEQENKKTIQAQTEYISDKEGKEKNANILEI